MKQVVITLAIAVGAGGAGYFVALKRQPSLVYPDLTVGCAPAQRDDGGCACLEIHVGVAGKRVLMESNDAMAPAPVLR